MVIVLDRCAMQTIRRGTVRLRDRRVLMERVWWFPTKCVRIYTTRIHKHIQILQVVSTILQISIAKKIGRVTTNAVAHPIPIQIFVWTIAAKHIVMQDIGVRDQTRNACQLNEIVTLSHVQME